MALPPTAMLVRSQGGSVVATEETGAAGSGEEAQPRVPSRMGASALEPAARALEACGRLSRDAAEALFARAGLKRYYPRKGPRSSEARAARSPACSFCRRSDDEVNRLIAGPAKYICDRCILEADEIASSESSSEE